MAVFRIERTRDYTVMSNHHLRNANLSLKAKGLLSMMLSLPEDWNYTTRGLAKICKEGVDAIGAALRELERAGYIVRYQKRDKNGRITDTEYVIYEQPQPGTDDQNETDPQTPDAPEASAAQQTAQALLDTMTDEEKIWQLFFVTPEAITNVNTATVAGETTKKALEQYPVGGIVYFAKNLEDREQTVALLENTQSYAKIPLFLGVDEEGGTVSRVGSNPDMGVPSVGDMRSLGKQQDPAAAYAAGQDIGGSLHALGFNLDFAPVADVAQGADSVIGSRSFGSDPELCASLAGVIVKSLRAEGIVSCLKHFPGYGNNADTHTGVAIDKRPYETFEQSDFLPFRAGMGAGAPFVLVSHNVVECMDAALPASLSPAVHEVLRETLGFDGIVITDDLAMDAVKQYANGEAAVLAVLAGNDMLITSDYQNDIPAVLAAVADGRIAEREIDAHVLRILRYKQAQGWIE